MTDDEPAESQRPEAAVAPAAPATPPAASATSAGRGVLYIAFAKLYFMVSGLFVQFRLPAILGQSLFGKYWTVNSWVSPVNSVLVTGSIQAVSRFAAQDDGNARAVQRAGLRMQLFIGVPVAALFIAGARAIAWIEKDASLTLPLMIAGLIVGGNAFYAVFVGTANGQRQFYKQAGLDISFATVRTAALVGMAMLGLGVTGVIAGWAAAVGVILCVAMIWVGLPGRARADAPVVSIAPQFKFFLKVALYLALFNALLFVDTWLLKRLSTAAYEPYAPALGAALVRALPYAPHGATWIPDVSQLADVQVGRYAAVQNLARIPYQLIIAATFVVFPLVSRSTFSDDRDTTRRYIEVTTRYSLMFAMAIAVVMAANPSDMLGVVYPPEYAAAGGAALAALALGSTAFSLFAIAGTILNGAGLTWSAIISAAITLVVAAVANWIAIPIAVHGDNLLGVTALVTSGAMVLGALLTGFQLRARFAAFLPLLSFVRILIAGAVAIAVGRVIPVHGKLLVLGRGVVVAGVFLAVLIASRELGKRDLSTIRVVRSKRSQEGGSP